MRVNNGVLDFRNAKKVVLVPFQMFHDFLKPIVCISLSVGWEK